MDEHADASQAPATPEAVAVKISVCFASPTAQHLIELVVLPTTTIEQAARSAFPHLDLSQYRVGIFGKLKTPQTCVREYDRVEIYRPLLADPKESRRRRAAHKA